MKHDHDDKWVDNEYWKIITEWHEYAHKTIWGRQFDIYR